MSDFRIKTLVLGMVGTNCYVIYREGSGQAIVVDPADQEERILEECQKLGVTPAAVLLTHGHFDHITAAEKLRRETSCRIYGAEAEAPLFRDPELNLSRRMGGERVSLTVDEEVRDGQILTLSGWNWQVIATPGHTAGSVCYYLPEEAVLLSGDTLFCRSLGRTDLPTGSSGQILHSICERLFVLPDDTLVYPGHGEPTVIGVEKQCNPAAYYWRKQK